MLRAWFDCSYQKKKYCRLGYAILNGNEILEQGCEEMDPKIAKNSFSGEVQALLLLLRRLKELNISGADIFTDVISLPEIVRAPETAETNQRARRKILPLAKEAGIGVDRFFFKPRDFNLADGVCRGETLTEEKVRKIEEKAESIWVKRKYALSDGVLDYYNRSIKKESKGEVTSERLETKLNNRILNATRKFQLGNGVEVYAYYSMLIFVEGETIAKIAVDNNNPYDKERLAALFSQDLAG